MKKKRFFKVKKKKLINLFKEYETIIKNKNA